MSTYGMKDYLAFLLPSLALRGKITAMNLSQAIAHRVRTLDTIQVTASLTLDYYIMVM